jgi:hypothetical protein
MECCGESMECEVIFRLKEFKAFCFSVNLVKLLKL